VCVIQSSSDLVNWSPVYTNVTSRDGTFDYTNAPAPPAEFYRAVGAL
jgi:hypothetical protein